MIPSTEPRRAVALAALVPLLAAGCGGGPQGDPAGEDGPQGDAPVPAVEAVQARRGVLPLRERLTGTVRAAGQVAIYPEASGRVVEVLAQNGDRVERGEALVRIRAETSESQLAQASANLDAARAQSRSAAANLEELEAQFQRTRTLAEDSLVSQEALETQRAQLEAARSAHAQARAQVQQAEATVAERQEAVSQTVVRAPISGRVGQRNAEVGMRVDGQTALYTIGRLDEMRVEVPVTQEMLASLEVGQRVEIRAENVPDTIIQAEVSRISPFLAEGTFSAEAEVDIPNDGGFLLPGMFVTADVFYGESDSATIVPQSALYEQPETGREGIYVATSLGTEIQPASPSGEDGMAPLTPPGLARFREVEVVAQGDQTVGLRGIEPGAWVVVVGQQLLSEQTTDGAPQARVRPVSWDRVVSLQRLQRQDLLREFMAKQQRLARQDDDSASAESGESSDDGASPL